MRPLGIRSVTAEPPEARLCRRRPAASVAEYEIPADDLAACFIGARCGWSAHRNATSAVTRGITGSGSAVAAPVVFQLIIETLRLAARTQASGASGTPAIVCSRIGGNVDRSSGRMGLRLLASMRANPGVGKCSTWQRKPGAAGRWRLIHGSQ